MMINEGMFTGTGGWALKPEDSVYREQRQRRQAYSAPEIPAVSGDSVMRRATTGPFRRGQQLPCGQDEAIRQG